MAYHLYEVASFGIFIEIYTQKPISKLSLRLSVESRKVSSLNSAREEVRVIYVRVFRRHDH